MSTRMSGTVLLLIALVLLLNAGDFAAQDPPQTPPQTMPAAPQATQTAPPDLSGTYSGTFNCDSIGLMGDTTLTITGNQFTTADGKTGRIVASKSGGYTAVALQVGEPTAATPAPVVSLRARKSGNRLILTSAPGATMKCSFTPASTSARGRRNQRTPAAKGTDVSNPSTAPVPTTTPAEPAPMPAQTPSPSPSPTATPSPEPSPTPSPEPSPTPSPEPNPSPAPSPAPSPQPNPSPMPSPTASPTPSPTPSPRPR